MDSTRGRNAANLCTLGSLAPTSSSPDSVDLFVCYCSSASSSDCVRLSTTRRFQYKSLMASPAPPPAFADENVLAQVEVLHPLHAANAGPVKRGRSPVLAGNIRRFVRRNSSDSRPPEGRRWSNPDCINLSSFVDTDCKWFCASYTDSQMADMLCVSQWTNGNVRFESSSAW